MPESQSGKETARSKVLERLVASIPSQYRDEVARVANGIRDRLPPIMVEHRIDALERHLDARLDEIEKKIAQVLARLDK